MLVIVSDLHLTDGSSGTTINAGAFKEFERSVMEMVNDAKAKRVEIVFLGDVIDVIRSTTWLETSIRPWSDDTDTDQNGKRLKDYVVQITKDICNRPENLACASHIATLKQALLDKDVPVNIAYITGNHDWLVNRYDETRALASNFLQLDSDANQRFPVAGEWDEYGVFARHGDIYDEFNYDGDRDASSMGDAIVIELLNKFPVTVAKELDNRVQPEFLSLLKEIDNVRPLLDAPLWIVSACEQVGNKALSDRVHAIWDKTANDFLSIPFVRKHDKLFSLTDPFDRMEAALLVSERLKLGQLSSILEWPILKVFQGQSDLIERAAREDAFQNGKVDFVVYGHTHEFGIWPIGKFIKPSLTIRQSYINTGTWRKVFEHGKHAAFSGWNVVTFVCFYLEEERGDYLFETWNGSLA